MFGRILDHIRTARAAAPAAGNVGLAPLGYHPIVVPAATATTITPRAAAVFRATTRLAPVWVQPIVMKD